jgi:hypothetical protein
LETQALQREVDAAKAAAKVEGGGAERRQKLQQRIADAQLESENEVLYV